jgi:hypothetical protein
MNGGLPLVVWQRNVFVHIEHAWELLPLRAASRSFRRATEERFRQLYGQVFAECVPKCTLELPKHPNNTSWCSLYRLEGELFPLGHDSPFVVVGQTREQGRDLLRKVCQQRSLQEGAFLLRLSETSPHVLWVMWKDAAGYQRGKVGEERCTRSGDGYVFRNQSARTVWDLFALLVPVVGHLYWITPNFLAMPKGVKYEDVHGQEFRSVLGTMMKTDHTTSFRASYGGILFRPLPSVSWVPKLSIQGSEYLVPEEEDDVYDGRDVMHANIFITLVNAFVASRYLLFVETDVRGQSAYVSVSPHLLEAGIMYCRRKGKILFVRDNLPGIHCTGVEEVPSAWLAL